MTSIYKQTDRQTDQGILYSPNSNTGTYEYYEVDSLAVNGQMYYKIVQISDETQFHKSKQQNTKNNLKKVSIFVWKYSIKRLTTESVAE